MFMSSRQTNKVTVTQDTWVGNNQVPETLRHGPMRCHPVLAAHRGACHLRPGHAAEHHKKAIGFFAAIVAAHAFRLLPGRGVRQGPDLLEPLLQDKILATVYAGHALPLAAVKHISKEFSLCPATGWSYQ